MTCNFVDALCTSTVHVHTALTMRYAYVQSLQMKDFSSHVSERSTGDIISFSSLSDCRHTYTHHRGL